MRKSEKERGEGQTEDHFWASRPNHNEEDKKKCRNERFGGITLKSVQDPVRQMSEYRMNYLLNLTYHSQQLNTLKIHIGPEPWNLIDNKISQTSSAGETLPYSGLHSGGIMHSLATSAVLKSPSYKEEKTRGQILDAAEIKKLGVSWLILWPISRTRRWQPGAGSLTRPESGFHKRSGQESVQPSATVTEFVWRNCLAETAQVCAQQITQYCPSHFHSPVCSNFAGVQSMQAATLLAFLSKQSSCTCTTSREKTSISV